MAGNTQNKKALILFESELFFRGADGNRTYRFQYLFNQ